MQQAQAPRVVLALAAVAAAAAGLLVLTWPSEAAEHDSLLLWMALPLLLVLPLGAALWQWQRRLRSAAAEARSAAARAAELEVQLARAGRQRHEMLDKISHDLRTPLASLQGYLELLLLRHGSVDAAEAQNYLQTAVRHAERLSRLVGDLLELTRLEADTIRLQREPFPMAELAHDVVQRFAGAATRSQVRLEVAAAQLGTPLVLADVALVERVLGNLVENALRHTPAGGRVTIEVGGGAEAAHVAVADTGEGIASAELPGVFDRYATASRVGDTGSSKAGLGLAIARRIAALHGSALEVQSRPGAGTRVSFTLPLAPRAPAAARAPSRAAAPPPVPAPMPGTPGR